MRKFTLDRDLTCSCSQNKSKEIIKHFKILNFNVMNIYKFPTYFPKSEMKY